MLVHKYNENNLVFSVDTISNCSFDKLLASQWENAMEKDLFRYKLTKNSLPHKILHGKFNYIAQLNQDRAEKRRKPQEILSQNQPFSPDQFNFNKVHDNEILLRLEPYWSSQSESDSGPDEHLVLINVSPLEYCHVLITPFRNHNRVQKVTREGLRLSLDLSLQSESADIRLGFNSLCGFASVNHEHWHLYHLSHRLFLEHAPLKKVTHGKECFELEHEMFPPCLCFLLTNINDLSRCIDNVMKLTTFMWENEIAHNVYITRGSSDNQEGHFDCIRIFVWARLPSFGAKGCDAFNPALCELAGHFPIKNERTYDILTEEDILNELHGICDEPFQIVRKWVVEHF